MGLIYVSKEEKELYKAYGITVYGVQNRYEWTVVVDKGTEDVYTSLRLEKDGETIFDEHLGNRFIFKDNFDRTIDNFLWWIDKDSPDSYSIEHSVYKSLCQTDSLFNHLIEQRKRREQNEEEARKRQETVREEREKQVAILMNYCEENNLFLKISLEKAYLIKLHNNKVKGLIEGADYKEFEGLKEFMLAHPDNQDATLVMYGEIAEVLDKISLDIVYIKQEELPKYWETKSICIEFADGSDALAQENGYTLEQCMEMGDVKFFLD